MADAATETKTAEAPAPAPAPPPPPEPPMIPEGFVPSMTDASNSKSGKTFAELYDVDKQLGEGTFSTVQLGHHKESGTSYAIKTIIKKQMYPFDKLCLREEIKVLTDVALYHEHIIRLWDVFDEPDYYYLITELVEGGMLFDRIVKKSQYTEKEARDCCKILFAAIRHIHDHQVAHRDLKPENLLLMSNDDDSSIKIADFGFAKKLTHPESLKTQCGSAAHVAPEILNKVPYGTSVDMWSLGVIVFTLMGGYRPFDEETNRVQFRKIRDGEYKFYESRWSAVSEDAKEMIRGLLTVDVKDRLTAVQVLEEDKWMNAADETELRRHSLLGNLEELQKLQARTRFKGAVHTVIAVNKVSKLKSLSSNLEADLAE